MFYAFPHVNCVEYSLKGSTIESLTYGLESNTPQIWNNDHSCWRGTLQSLRLLTSKLNLNGALFFLLEKNHSKSSKSEGKKKLRETCHYLKLTYQSCSIPSHNLSNSLPKHMCVRRKDIV